MNIRRKIGLSVLAVVGAIAVPVFLQAQSDIADHRYPISISNARVALLESGEVEIVGDIVLDASITPYIQADLREGKFMHSGYLITTADASVRDGEMRTTSVRISIKAEEP